VKKKETYFPLLTKTQSDQEDLLGELSHPLKKDNQETQTKPDSSQNTKRQLKVNLTTSVTISYHLLMRISYHKLETVNAKYSS